MTMLGSVKAALRISLSNTTFDDEVNDLIAAAREDMRIAGVLQSKLADETDVLIKRAITTYCKTNFGFDNPDADRLQQSYLMLKTHLSLSQEYTGENL